MKRARFSARTKRPAIRSSYASVPRGRQAIVAERFTAPRPRSSETPSLRAPESCGASSATATSHRAAAVILVTAGWPYLDEQRLGLGDAVRDLRAAGARLVVLRVPARVEYQGLVHDASEAIATRLSATFIALNDQPDVERAQQALADAEQVAPPTSANIPAVVARNSRTDPPRGRVDRARMPRRARSDPDSKR